jgi:tRNA nucleotidyltransferase (CCA-adding enzyme)
MPVEINIIIDLFRQWNFQLFLVGGCTRDFLLKRPINDWDMATDATPDQMKMMFNDKNIKTIETGIKHGTLTVIVNDIDFEITTFRTEFGFSDNRHPDKVEFVHHLFEDLMRRDFTINAIAFDLINNKWSDNDISNQGKINLNAGIIKSVGSPEKRFKEDALRILRMYRLACQLEFQIDINTLKYAHKTEHLLKNISMERITSELNKIMKSNRSSNGLELMNNIFEWLIPEFVECFACGQNNPHHIFTVGNHILESIKYLDRLEQDDNVFIAKWVIFFHDIGKPFCKTTNKTGDHFYNHSKISMDIAIKTMRKLKFPTHMINRISNLVLYHDMCRFDMCTKLNVKKFLQKLGQYFYENNMLEQFILVLEADCSSQNFTKDKFLEIQDFVDLVDEIIESKDPLFISDLDITGKDIMDKLHINGKQIGIILDRCLSHVLKRPSDNKKEILLKLLKGISK